MVFVLLEAGADPTLLNFQLFTSLHYAAWMGFLPYVQLIEALCVFAIFSQCYKPLKGMSTNYIVILEEEVFVGRETEVEELTDLIGNSTVSTISIVGSSGFGN